MHSKSRDLTSSRPVHKSWALPACAFAAALSMACPRIEAATFAEQTESAKQAVESQTEAAIIELLEAGLEEHQPAQAAAIASDWLRANLPESPRLLFLLGRSSELSGDWREAVAFYQQFLKRAEPKTEEASEAITAVYTLLIDYLDDVEAAYNFGRLQAQKLSVNLRFRQFDRWFLDNARERSDLEAVTERLLATATSGVDADYMVTFHAEDLFWLLNAIHTIHPDNKAQHFDESFVTKIKALAQTLDYNLELQLLLDWKVSVKDYIMARLAGRETEAPCAAAEALLKKFPSYAEEVQTDWAGGWNGRHYRGNAKEYWPHQLEDKWKPIKESVTKLNELQQAELFETWSGDYYDGGPVVLGTEQSRALIAEHPEWINRRTGPILDLDWNNNLSVEDAKKLAPALEFNSTPEAALIRTVANAGKDKDYDKMMTYLLEKEAWRLGSSQFGRYADTLWNWAGKPGGNAKRDQQTKRSRKLAESIPNEKSLAKLPANQRLKKFQQLWKEYTSPNPRTPAILNQIRDLLTVTPEAMAELLSDSSLDGRMLAQKMLNVELKDGDKRLIQSRDSILRTGSFNPVIARLAKDSRGMSRLKADKEKYQPYALLPAIENALRRQIKDDSPEAWLVTAWLNARFPENEEEDVKIMQALLQSSGWMKLPYETRHFARLAYPKLVLNESQNKLLAQSDPAVVCASLLALGETATAEEATEALTSATDTILSAPTRISPPDLDALAALDDTVWEDSEFGAALVEFIDRTRLTTPYRDFGNRVIGLAAKQGDAGTILHTAAYMWTNVQAWHQPMRQVMEMTASLASEQPEAANALARAGLHTIARHKRGHTWFDRETDIPALKTIRGKTAMDIGLVEIPVPSNDPTYPIYLSQAEWMSDNIDTAWTLIDANWETFLPIHRELTVPYTMWVLERSIETRNSERQQALIQPLLQWAKSPTSTLQNGEKAAIEIAYGDIAMQRSQIREAIEIFKRVEDSEAYQELPVRHEATLRRVRALRVAKDFDGALEILAELALDRIPGLWIDIRYARAEIYYDMEEYSDAQDDIASILNREPNHSNARILLGKVQLKRQKLMEATEVELGSNTEEPMLVPGENLKVTLSDPTLAVSGAGTEIEVLVWTSTGDREQFFLRQFGDQKTKFRGEVATALGAPSPEDGTLQVIGNDEVYYAYSERFLEKMNLTVNKRGGPIRVASDGLLMASARKLLTEAEQRIADMQATMEQLQENRTSNIEAATRAKLASQATDSGDEISHERYLAKIAKPGNPIHIRVIDPDRSRTAGIDELVVSANTSSGDSISRITLRETETHSGWFEGSVPTTGAPPRALAPDSQPGRNPNMVISPKPDYPAWQPTEGGDSVPEFVIDLNDRVDLGRLKLTAREPKSALRKFILQTGMNRSDWTTVAVYPKNPVSIEKPWQPSVLVMNDTDDFHTNNKRSVYDLGELQEQVEGGWLTQTYAAGAADNVAGISEAMAQEIPGQVEWKRQNRHHNAHIIYRFRGYFHEPRKVTRRFKLELGDYKIPKGTHPSVADPPQFLLAVNGKPITDPEQPQLLEGEIELQAGIHQFEIWATGWDCTIGFGRSMKLLANLEDPETLVEFPDALFDPATFPADSLDHRNTPASIAADKEGKSFTVEFAPDSHARLIRFLFFEQEGTVPTINKISLNDTGGNSILPTVDDFAKLNKNDTLEILTGDRITVRYQDDRFVTEAKQKLERFLSVSFTDARIEFVDPVPRITHHTKGSKPVYSQILRFKHDEAVAVLIRDPDMDSTENPDTVQVELSSNSGGSTTLTATETGDSTGIFLVRLTPVAGVPAAKDQIQVAEGGTLYASCDDVENNRPGIPTKRTASVLHAAYVKPSFVLSNAIVSAPEPEEAAPVSNVLVNGFNPWLATASDNRNKPSERIRPRWKIDYESAPASAFTDRECQTVLGHTLYLELIAPQYALRTGSSVKIYAQTESGRKAASSVTEPFDISIPGTIEIDGSLYQGSARPKVGWRSIPKLASYIEDSPWSLFAENSFDRFFAAIPVVPGLLPQQGVLSKEERNALTISSGDLRTSGEESSTTYNSLVAKPGEVIHVGFKYKDENGETRWLTTKTRTITHPAFDIMTEDYHSDLRAAYAGEYLNLRVVDLGADTSDEHDTVKVLMQARSGAKYWVVLHETGTHTGIFKENVKLTHTKDTKSLPEELDVGREGFPIIYGDTVAARYTDRNQVNTDTIQVTISKGANGRIIPFSKKYEDKEIAMRTQFSLAEAYLEMAKRHRKLGQSDKADQEYASAKLLLSKAMDQFTEPDTRAHAEYLLGMLTMEEAIATDNNELKETRFRAALSRFMNVTGTYPFSLHASRSQYRIASIYEELKEPEIAAQEYVKLAYKYPDSEFLATSMAKLGTHFLKQASRYEQEAKPLLARAEEDKDAAFEGEALQKIAEREYLKTASIFSRLLERFPGNRLAGPAGLRAGQAYMRAERYRDAIQMFSKVISEQSYDGPEVRAQAMYWSGMCQQEIRMEMAAYSIFKRLTYDFPESKWAAYARAQLSQNRLLQLENRLELQRLEAGQ